MSSLRSRSGSMRAGQWSIRSRLRMTPRRGGTGRTRSRDADISHWLVACKASAAIHDSRWSGLLRNVGERAMSNNENGTVGSALGKFLDRIVDRLLPERDGEISPWMKFWSIFAGLIVWCFYGLAVGIDRATQKVIGQETQLFDEFPYTWSGLISIDLVFMAVILLPMIHVSFKRGRPLTFFFWGLIFPAAAMNLLRLSFP